MPYIGFEKIESELNSLYQNKKLPHAIILSGKKGIGKSSFALDFALKSLNSNNKNHPDLLLVKKDEEKRDLNIDKIRKISSFLNQTGAISQNRFIIIDSADDFNRSSSNALLKTLEEPTKNCYIILICHQISKILPTIKSRCQNFHISDFDYEKFSSALNKIRPAALPKLNIEDVEILSEICDNCPAIANKFGDEMIFIYKKFLKSLEENIIDEDLIKKISDKKIEFKIISDVMSFFFVRLIKFLTHNNNKLLLNEAEVFDLIAKKYKIDDIFYFNDKSQDLLRKTQSLNLDKKLTIINILNFFI